jgi:hypothetical protein
MKRNRECWILMGSVCFLMSMPSWLAGFDVASPDQEFTVLPGQVVRVEFIIRTADKAEFTKVEPVSRFDYCGEQAVVEGWRMDLDDEVRRNPLATEIQTKSGDESEWAVLVPVWIDARSVGANCPSGHLEVSFRDTSTGGSSGVNLVDTQVSVKNLISREDRMIHQSFLDECAAANCGGADVLAFLKGQLAEKRARVLDEYSDDVREGRLTSQEMLAIEDRLMLEEMGASLYYQELIRKERCELSRREWFCLFFGGRKGGICPPGGIDDPALLKALGNDEYFRTCSEIEEAGLRARMAFHASETTLGMKPVDQMSSELPQGQTDGADDRETSEWFNLVAGMIEKLRQCPPESAP